MKAISNKTSKRNSLTNSNKSCALSTVKVSSLSHFALRINRFVAFFTMENLSAGMMKPCTIDIKLGSKAYNPKKIERQKWKNSCSTSASLGFRMCGFSVYADDSEEA